MIVKTAGVRRFAIYRRIALLLDIWRKGMPADIEVFSRALYAVAKTVVSMRGVSYAG